MKLHRDSYFLFIIFGSHFHFTTFFSQVYATPATSQPLVYINNVTANVNVHHGGVTPETGPRPMVSHSGFPPPPPNPMPYPAGPTSAPPAGLILPPPPQNPPFLYQHQFAALAKTAAPQPYMHAPQVIYYPYPIPVSQPQPQPQPAPAPQPPQRVRSSPTMMPPMMAPPTTASVVSEPYFIPTQPQVQPKPTVPSQPQPQPQPQAQSQPPQPSQPLEPVVAVAKEEETTAKNDVEAKPTEEVVVTQTEPQQPQQSQQPQTVQEPEAPKSEDDEPKNKSWASLFHKDIPVNVISSNKPMARIQPYTMPEHPKAEPKKKETNDDLEMAKFLQGYNLTHR